MSTAFTADFERRLSDAGFPDMTFSLGANVMRFLRPGGAVRMGSLTEMSGVTKQAISQQVAYLEARGYVAVEPDAADSRVKLVRLTKKGQRSIEAAQSLFTAVEGDWGQRFGDDEMIAGELVRRGHRVRFLGHKRQRSSVEGAGFGFDAYRHARPYSAIEPLPTAKAIVAIFGMFTDGGPGVDLRELIGRTAGRPSPDRRDEPGCPESRRHVESAGGGVDAHLLPILREPMGSGTHRSSGDRPWTPTAAPLGASRSRPGGFVS